MTTDYHTPFGIAEAIDIAEINERLASLDSGISGKNPSGTFSVAILEETQATTVDGGSASATTWNQRGNLTEVSDADSIVTVSTNTFTPIAGEYEIEVAACAAYVGVHRVKLYNATQTSDERVGLNMDCGTSGIMQQATLRHRFTANGSDAYRIDHYTTSARATDGLGIAVGDGANEVYCEILLIKLD